MANDRLPTLKAGWLASLPPGSPARLGRLRPLAGIEVCGQSADTLWLRGPALDPLLRMELRAILGCKLYGLLSDGQLLPDGARVPRGYAPTLGWRPLREWLTVVLPTPRFAAAELPRVELSLVRCWEARPAALVVVSRGDWLDYVVAAPQARLARLEFAAGQRSVIVRGEPLPPIRGEFYHVDHGVAAPVGYAWRPAIDAAVLKGAFELEEGDVAVLWRAGGSSVVRGDRFVGASRSAVRLMEAAADGGP
ncbi:hypothetical protein Pla175_18080 [Pirellulimonas nuda]|uniref:MoxR-vWA-beta-propeller ternary system domain-containing protein n=1 Tax=Pirellulimonas nuda TaxID=2528009 RepID=A0A518DAC4_9BACT|nr:hypothetical protein [Pirellulimonas nuda]QDU88430.1 hypothetical protein Pla175_18080 [Pirellulimonas nuda]